METKRSHERRQSELMSKYAPHLFLTLALIMNAAANVLIKYSATRTVAAPLGENAPFLARMTSYISPFFVIAVVLFGLNLLAYSVALRSFRISIAYPIMVSGAYVLILIAGWFLFQERLTAVQYAGIGLILAGLWLVVR